MTTEARRLADAVGFAFDAHDGQYRKGEHRSPYIGHPVAVASLVIENGGSWDEAIAALLHDVPEDGAGDPLVWLDEIGRLFGGRVQEIVRLASDTLVKPKPDWLERKQAYIRRVAEHAAADEPDTGYLRVTTADKLHNARSILADLERDGLGVFDVFRATQEQTLWYYGALEGALSLYDGPDEGLRYLISQLSATVDRILQAVK